MSRADQQLLAEVNEAPDSERERLLAQLIAMGPCGREFLVYLREKE